MEGNSLNVNLIIGISGLVISMMGLIQVFVGFRYAGKIRRFFSVFFLILILYTGMNLLDQLVYTVPGAVTVTKIALFLESTFSSILMLLLSGFLLDSCGIEYRRHPLLITSIILWLLYMGLLIITQFTTIIYSFDANGTYHRGDWYPVLLIPPVLIMLVNLVALICFRKRLSVMQRFAFASYLVLPLISMLIQMLSYGIYVIVLGTSIAAFFMSTYNLLDQTERFYKQEMENEKLKSSILMAEVRPHFIFNSLTAIRSCLDEPDKAEKALNHFTGFLRSSIDVLKETECISIRKEMKTVENYLYLAKERFGEKLTVIQETEDVDFLLPSFAVQTLVENAIQHGIRENKGGRGTLQIRCFRDHEAYVTEVEDDGAGFREEKEDSVNGRSHVGLSNLRKRLELMCDGRLEIRNEPGKGTLARIRIPVTKNRIIKREGVSGS